MPERFTVLFYFIIFVIRTEAVISVVTARECHLLCPALFLFLFLSSL